MVVLLKSQDDHFYSFVERRAEPVEAQIIMNHHTELVEVPE